MNHQTFFGKACFLMAVFLCLLSLAKAQKADFTIDKPAGCPGLTVHFTNTSTGFSAAATYKWDFGNGNTSTVKNPGANYNDPKVYTVKLTVTDGGKTDTKANTVTVYKLPTANFSASVASGCQPLPVTFTSTSTPGDGTIATYYWDYGDGNSESAGAQPRHTYTIPQEVTASLTVTNSYGCYSTLPKPVVKVFPSVTSAFTAAQTVLCKVTDAVTFTNTSSGSASLSYAWDFGDGTTSGEKEPSHVFGKKGTFTIKLGVKSSDGCKNESMQTDYINVANFTTDFSVPALICENTSTAFTNTSNPQLSSNQDWLVDGYDYYGYNQFTYTFPAARTYKVQMVNTYGSCADTATKSITVQPTPEPNSFVADLQGACGAPVTVQFKDTTAGAVKWAWDFNSDYYSFNPTDTKQATSNKYTSDGSYLVILQVTNAAGCSAKTSRYVSVYHPNASINSSRGIYGCTNLSTVFSVSSQSVLKTYNWDFGDGTKSTEAAPEHNFTKAGNYNVQLTYTDSNGCGGTADFPISVLGKPSFDFAAESGTTICGNTPVNFTVTGSNTNGYYNWDFGDNGGYYYSTIPSHQYYYDSTYTVSLIISNYGCSDTVIKKDYIKVLPPFPKIASQTNTCDGTRGLVTFTESSVKSLGWSWDFGDGSTAYSYNSFQDSIKHTYTKTGSYKVVLTAKNGSCSVRDSTTAYVLLKQKPSLTAPQTEVCGSDNLQVTVANLETNPTYNNNFYYNYRVNYFEYGDSTTFNGNVSNYYYDLQNNSQLNLSNLDNTKKDLRLVTTSYYFNCVDTTNYIAIKVKGPSSGYKLADNNKCFKTPVQFVDTSAGSNGVEIVKWEWNFGDGQTAVTTGGNTSHVYTTPGQYYTSLTVTDKDGCTATANHYGDVITIGTKAAFNVSQNPVLPNIPIYFYNNSYGGNYYSNSYLWQFGDGANEKDDPYYTSPVHSYAETGIDTVRLIIKDESTNCIDTAVQYINVKNTNLSFSVATSYINPGSGCPPMQAKFTNTSNNVQSVKWDFGDGTTADNLNYPSHIYDKPGNYKVTIYGYFYDNSVDSSYDYVTIAGPYATLTADKLFTCGSATPVTLSAAASNTTSYTWDFGDGTLVDATDTFATHAYLTPNVYTPSLIVRDGNNCSFPFFLAQPIVIDTLHLAINKSPLVTCDSSLTLFTPGITSVARDLGQPLTYFWNFGTGNIKDTANTESSSFVYSSIDSYTVSLRAVSPYGCVEETSIPVIVKPTPKGSIAGTSSVCEGLTATFTGSSDVSNPALTWQWNFPNRTASSLQNPPAQLFTTPGINSVQMIINNEGCYDTVYHAITVYAKPVVDIIPKDSFVCLGNAIQLEAHDGVIYKWLQATNISNKAIANPLVSPAVTTSYKVEVTNNKGCISQDSVSVRVRQPFTITAPVLLYLCKGSSLQLNVSGADTYQWTGTGLDNLTAAAPVTTTQTPQTYMVVGFDNDHCFTDTAMTEVRIAELPSVKTIDDITVFAGSPVELATTGSSDVTAWSWTPTDYLSCTNCSSPASHPKSEVLYIVKATTGYGCSKQDSVHINIICKQSLVQIPGAFTPGGDGKNDRFIIKGQGIKIISHFVIFNRSGAPVFEKRNVNANDTSAGWDGTYLSRTADAGSYVYIADILCDTGELFHYKGTVVLIR